MNKLNKSANKLNITEKDSFDVQNPQMSVCVVDLESPLFSWLLDLDGSVRTF